MLTVSGPTTFDGGGIERFGLRSSGPGLLRDNRFLVEGKSTALVRGDVFIIPPALLIGLAAKSRPCDVEKYIHI